MVEKKILYGTDSEPNIYLIEVEDDTLKRMEKIGEYDNKGKSDVSRKET